MNQPLGRAVGNALEVSEAIACLQGEGPADLANLVCKLIGDPRAREVLCSGAAYPRFCAMVAAQGGDATAPLLGAGCTEHIVVSPMSGTVTACDALGIGEAAFVLGAGRIRADAPVHPGVGIVLHKKIGASVEAGEPLATLWVADRGLERAQTAVSQAFQIGA
jgi:thymidine phosphorylase